MRQKLKIRNYYFPFFRVPTCRPKPSKTPKKRGMRASAHAYLYRRDAAGTRGDSACCFHVHDSRIDVELTGILHHRLTKSHAEKLEETTDRFIERCLGFDGQRSVRNSLTQGRPCDIRPFSTLEGRRINFVDDATFHDDGHPNPPKNQHHDAPKT